MLQSTNQLVAAAKKLVAPAAIVGAFALGAANSSSGPCFNSPNSRRSNTA
jgi:hypothetical protein